MVCPAVSRGRCLSIRDISIYESIPHCFLGRPEFAMKPASMVIVEMKLRGTFQIDPAISLGYWKTVVPNTVSRALSHRWTSFA